jgi:hypothetical protein
VAANWAKILAKPAEPRARIRRFFYGWRDPAMIGGIMSDVACSACGRSKAQVTRLHSARPGGNSALTLCNHCVLECAAAIEDAPTRIPGGKNQCEYCGKDEGTVAVLVAVGRRKVCDECIDAFSR